MPLFLSLLGMFLALLVLGAANFLYQIIFMEMPDYDIAVQRTMIHGSVLVLAAVFVIYFHVKFLRKKKVEAPVPPEESV